MIAFSMLQICGICPETVGKRYDTAQCKLNPRPFGSDRFIAFHCSVDFADILDVSESGEWDTYLDDGKILLSPSAGNFQLSDGSADVLVDGCGTEFTDVTTRPWTFTTFSTAENYSDEKWWRDFHLAFPNYNFGWLSCNGRLSLRDEAATAINAELASVTPGPVPVNQPGFVFSISKIPTFESVNGNGKTGQWATAGNFKHSTVITSVGIPGLAALLATKG